MGNFKKHNKSEKMKNKILYLTAIIFLLNGCVNNSSKDKKAQQDSKVTQDIKSKSKPKRLTSEEMYKAINDSLFIIFQKVINSINYKTGELKVLDNELIWSSNKYPDIFWNQADFELSAKKKQIGNKIYYFTSCLKKGVDVNIFGYILLENQSQKYILKDTCFNIISEKYFNDTWTFNYYLTSTKDNLPIVVFRVGQGEETVAYRETIALFDVTKRKLIGDNITTRDMYDGEEENNGYNWESNITFSNTSFVNDYPDFIIKPKGTILKNKKVVEYNEDIIYKFDAEIGKYRKLNCP